VPTVAYRVNQLQRYLGAKNNVALDVMVVVSGIISLVAWPPALTGVTFIDPAT
jgi:hypothetical protein